MSEQQSFGYWLRLKRKALDLTREGLADRVGCSAATIHKLEDEERRPSAQMAERLAEIFAIPENERAAFLRFARGDWKSAPADNGGEAPWRPPAQPSRSNLPATVTSLVGRVKEIDDVRSYLANSDIRLVTLIGPPGIGKTRLSIEVARAALIDFSDGVFFVALAPLDDRNLIPSAIARALGYVGAKDISTSEQIKEGIGNKNLLLVLDNCEHLIEDVSSLASMLLSACSHLKILSTSRESLRIAGEWLYLVPAFDVPSDGTSIDLETISNFPAMKLFSERARAVRPDFVLSDENVGTVSAICARLDGLPLIIELIAARLRLMSPEMLLERLSAQFVLTADGMRAASERQKTLNHAIRWSYDLLSPEEQRLFARLSVFSGGFSLDAVEAMFSQRGKENLLPPLIASLLDKSLIKLASKAEVSREARYTMLVTIQEFARERLREMGDEIEIQNIHLAHFLELAESADRELRGDNQLKWLRQLNADRDNLHAALNWAIETRQTETALQFARKLHWFWFIRGDHTEGRQWIGRVLDMSEAAAHLAGYAEALTQVAHHNYVQVGAKEARPFAERAIAIARAQNDKYNMAGALAILGLVLEQESFPASQATLEESMRLYQEIHDEWGYAHAVMCLSWACYTQEDYAGMLSLNEQALSSFRKLGDRYFQCVVLRGIGVSQVRQGNFAEGVTALQQALILARQLESKYEIAMTFWRFEEAADRTKQYARAVCLYQATRNVLDSIGAWTEGDVIIFNHDLERLGAALGESLCAAAMEQGRHMTMEQAIAYALEPNDD